MAIRSGLRPSASGFEPTSNSLPTARLGQSAGMHPVFRELLATPRPFNDQHRGDIGGSARHSTWLSVVFERRVRRAFGQTCMLICCRSMSFLRTLASRGIHGECPFAGEGVIDQRMRVGFTERHPPHCQLYGRSGPGRMNPLGRKIREFWNEALDVRALGIEISETAKPD